MNYIIKIISMVCGLWGILLMSSCAHFYDGTREDLKLAELAIADKELMDMLDSCAHVVR